jgi:hypothetical protein
VLISAFQKYKLRLSEAPESCRFWITSGGLVTACPCKKERPPPKKESGRKEEIGRSFTPPGASS